ncbi:MAG: DNA recombination protein RmuC [Alphaproteobacteria bacterium]|jgi:DNA recombination protein RmuC
MSFIWIAYAFVGAIIGVVIGFILAKKNDTYQKLYNSLLTDNQQKEVQLAELSKLVERKQTTIEYLETEQKKSEERAIKSEATLLEIRNKLSHYEAQQEFYDRQRHNDLAEIDTLKNQIKTITSEKEHITTLKADTELELNTISSQNTHLQQRLDTQIQEFKRLQETSEKTFENLAHKIFNEKSQSFTQKSEKTLNDVLSPVKESLNLFQALVTDKFSTQDKQQYALKEELKRIIDINEKMTFQANNLTKALKGDNKIMGNWGEMLLERILEDSGLSKDIDYVLQSSDYNLKDSDGKRQIPDVIVKLPDSKEIIIDAKVSLLDYERIVNDPDNRLMHEKSLLKSIRSHIDGLSAKKYYENEKLLSPDFVLMFLPVEGAYNLAMQLDHQLHHYAWNKRIAIVSNTTLFATLRTVSSLWRIEKQNKNADEIAKRAGLLYNKFSGFIDDMHSIDKRLCQTQATFDDAIGKLYKGSGNLISQVENLKQLGAKTSKSITTDSTKEYLMEKITTDA